jgi:hypothetical protein
MAGADLIKARNFQRHYSSRTLVRLSEEPCGAEKETWSSGKQRSAVAANLTARNIFESLNLSGTSEIIQCIVTPW